ncbi:MAG: hypothetical protein KF819_24665 [Labilithrix sp.]|nr:hypothetical protein [Labilithrix sp.]
MIVSRAGFTLAFVTALLVVACGKSTGSKCRAGESTCLDKDTALTCVNGKLAEVECKGPLGCTKFQEHARCDSSTANEGEPCMGQNEEEYACSADKKRALICRNGKFERHLECRGKAGCAVLGQQVSCDTSVAAKGDPCRSQGAAACSEDQKEMMICRDGKFATYRFCRGQFGCYMKADAPACDTTYSLEGDPCGLPNYVVCSVDKQSELICQGSTFVKSRPCRKSGCNVGAGGRVSCE